MENQGKKENIIHILQREYEQDKRSFKFKGKAEGKAEPDVKEEAGRQDLQESENDFKLSHEQQARENMREKRELDKAERELKQELLIYHTSKLQRGTELLMGFPRAKAFSFDKMQARVQPEFMQRFEKKN